MKHYIFFREQGWYPIECKDDADAIAHAKFNPGTQAVSKIEKGHGMRCIWEASPIEQSHSPSPPPIDEGRKG